MDIFKHAILCFNLRTFHKPQTHTHTHTHKQLGTLQEISETLQRRSASGRMELSQPNDFERPT